MKRFVAICLLVVCVALPLISWGAATYQCPKCGYYLTSNQTNVFTVRHHYNSRGHELVVKTSIYCRIPGCCETTVIQSTQEEPHIMQTKVIAWIPGMNLKQIEHSCAACQYKYTTYEPIDPSKPHGAIHN